MNAGWVTRHRRRLAISVLELGLAVGAAVVLVGAVPELARLGLGSPAGDVQPGASSPPVVPGSLAPIMVVMSPDADCGACHLDAVGGVRTPVIPVMAHPLEGWRDCTACHANDRLVKTAPGHSSLHKADCLVCHQAPVAGASPAPRPHHIPTDQPCIACHGKTAPLPTDMAGRNNCWVCHSGTEFQDLFGSPAPSSAPPSGSGAAPNGTPSPS
jgi:hypothetical protein